MNTESAEDASKLLNIARKRDQIKKMKIKDPFYNKINKLVSVKKVEIGGFKVVFAIQV